jgi:hypothetical protein
MTPELLTITVFGLIIIWLLKINDKYEKINKSQKLYYQKVIKVLKKSYRGVIKKEKEQASKYEDWYIKTSDQRSEAWKENKRLQEMLRLSTKDYLQEYMIPAYSIKNWKAKMCNDGSLRHFYLTEDSNKK